ncbi:MAG TPA: amidohydrolase family protein [Candidatus Paceibacterota bacterium]|nr:amidohydrolase family protein [Candidatus Paceibacterota bacterium]
MEILIKNAAIVTQNKNREIIERGFVSIKGKFIAAIGRGNPKKTSAKKQITIDASGYALFPGFINSHVHLGETIYPKFIGKKNSLESYIEITNKISLLSKIPEKERRTVCDYSLLKIIKSGTTAVAGGRTRESAESFEIINVSGYMLMQSPKLGKFSIDIEKNFSNEFRSSKKQLTIPSIFIHSLSTVDHKILSSVRYIKRKYKNIPIMVHAGETKEAEKTAIIKFGTTSVQTLNKYGLLGKQTLLVHANNLSREDVKLIINSGASVVHCLSSNLRLTGTTADIKYLKNKKANICIATDGYTTSGTLSVLFEARECYKYHNKEAETCLSAQEVFDMITINPAKALGISEKTGSIEKLKRADIVFIKINKTVTSKILSSLLSDDSMNPNGVIAGGKIMVWENKFVSQSESAIVRKFIKSEEKMAKDLARKTI